MHTVSQEYLNGEASAENVSPIVDHLEHVYLHHDGVCRWEPRCHMLLQRIIIIAGLTSDDHLVLRHATPVTAAECIVTAMIIEILADSRRNKSTPEMDCPRRCSSIKAVLVSPETTISSTLQTITLHQISQTPFVLSAQFRRWSPTASLLPRWALQLCLMPRPPTSTAGSSLAKAASSLPGSSVSATTLTIIGDEDFLPQFKSTWPRG